MFLVYYFGGSIFWNHCNHSLIEEGGDWDRRNRLKTYEGLYALSIRDFKKAAVCFFDTMATFTSTELMDYQTFSKYSIISCLLAQDRKDIKKQVCMVIVLLARPLPPEEPYISFLLIAFEYVFFYVCLATHFILLQYLYKTNVMFLHNPNIVKHPYVLTIPSSFLSEMGVG